MNRLLRMAAALGLLLSWAGVEAWGQRELVSPDHPVYQFLLRQDLNQRLPYFAWGMLPLSRAEIGRHLDSLSRRPNLSPTDQAILRDFLREFEFDIQRSLTQSISLLNDLRPARLVDDGVQRYLYAHADSQLSLFINLFGEYSYRWGNGDSVGSEHAALGQIGLRIRGSFFDRLGYFVEVSNGRLFGGSPEFAALDKRLKANSKFAEPEHYFDFSKGYLRLDVGWFSVMLGREQLLWGHGYGDRLVLSDNTVPFDYLRLDLGSKNVRYSFLHGSLVGADSSGRTLSSKYMAAHRLEVGIASVARIGLSEMVLYSNEPINFALMNPFTFLTSAELSTEMPGTGENKHNTLMELDAEVQPLSDLRLYGSFLIDDLNFQTLGDTGVARNSNKFGWQAGAAWNDAFWVANLLLSAEYARMDPFVMSHWTNANSYTHVDLPLGSSVQPNSDEWLFGAEYDVTNRLALRARLAFQRAGENSVDSTGAIVEDVGSDILHGENHLQRENRFLAGRRVNRTLASVVLRWQPIWQYKLEIAYMYRSYRFPGEGRELQDNIFSATVRVEL